MKELKFTVPGVCIPQSRPRAHRIGNRVIVHDAPKSISYKMDVAACAQKAIEEAGISVPIDPNGYGVTVCITIRKSFTKSMPKYKRAMAEDDKIRPITKPDLDNAAKGILDALNGVLWKDDSAVTTLMVQKKFAEMDSTDVTICYEDRDSEEG